MYEGNPVDLQMEKVISADGIFDDTTRACRVYKYDIEDEYIYLELKEDELTAILLDAKYRCYISTKTELLCCSGVVKERYRSEGINLLKFRIGTQRTVVRGVFLNPAVVFVIASGHDVKRVGGNRAA